MKRALIIIALVAVVGLPFIFRIKQTTIEHADETLVIITPHNEALRYEYARGFREWYRARTGKTVAIDWRVIGGTSEITRFLESEYVSSFQNYWTKKLGRTWSNEVLAAFIIPNLLLTRPRMTTRWQWQRDGPSWIPTSAAGSMSSSAAAALITSGRPAPGGWWIQVS